MAFECTAHEGFQPLALDVQNDGKWNVDIAEQVNVVCVCNVVDDERARYELFIVGVIAVRVIRV